MSEVLNNEVPKRVIKNTKEDKNKDSDSASITTLVGEAFEQNFERMLEFITEKVKLAELRLLFNGDNEPSMYELNKALAQHEHGRLGLILNYEASAYDYDRAKAVLEEFMAEKMSEVRTENNDPSKPASKWLAANEIEAIVQTQYKKEIALMKTDLSISERKKSTALRILDGWEKYGYTLSQMSRNAIAEINSHLRSNEEFNPND